MTTIYCHDTNCVHNNNGICSCSEIEINPYYTVKDEEARVECDTFEWKEE